MIDFKINGRFVEENKENSFIIKIFIDIIVILQLGKLRESTLQNWI